MEYPEKTHPSKTGFAPNDGVNGEFSSDARPFSTLLRREAVTRLCNVAVDSLVPSL